MKKLFFITTLLLASNAFAATGTGEAQAELSTPLKVENIINANFGTIAVDSSAGAQTVTLSTNFGGTIECPAAYACSGVPSSGRIRITRAPNTTFDISIVGSVAILSDGAGNQLVFDPVLGTSSEVLTDVNLSPTTGIVDFYLGGTIDFTGNEPAGTYSSTNAGGSGYQITVNY